MQIKNPSKELLDDAVATCPNIEHAEIAAEIAGFPYPEPGEPGYLSRCKKEGVIPYSTFDIRYAGSGLVNMGLRMKGLDLHGVSPEDQTQASLSLLEGRKPHQVLITADVDAQRFGKSAKGILNALRNNGYQCTVLDLWTGIYSSDYSGNRKDSGLMFLAGRGLELETRHMKPKDARKVEAWFRQLARKHGTKAVP